VVEGVELLVVLSQLILPTQLLKSLIELNFQLERLLILHLLINFAKH
jgi:hypothetical protein